MAEKKTEHVEITEAEFPDIILQKSCGTVQTLSIMSTGVTVDIFVSKKFDTGVLCVKTFLSGIIRQYSLYLLYSDASNAFKNEQRIQR